MAKDDYSIQQLVADLRRVTSETADEHEILSRIRPLARRAALSRDSWLEKRFYAADAEQGFGLHMLHEEPDHSKHLNHTGRSQFDPGKKTETPFVVRIES
jgi:predicted metal-dependent enzyme (double-stranded beta helix superfamily)